MKTTVEIGLAFRLPVESPTEDLVAVVEAAKAECARAVGVVETHMPVIERCGERVHSYINIEPVNGLMIDPFRDPCSECGGLVFNSPVDHAESGARFPDASGPPLHFKHRADWPQFTAEERARIRMRIERAAAGNPYEFDHRETLALLRRYEKALAELEQAHVAALEGASE